jgi:uncharacterized repeat protein (TIGR01451 family)
MLAPAASASSGDTKLLQVGGTEVTYNAPHLDGCSFTIQWSGFSVPPNVVPWALVGQAPSGSATVASGTVTLDANGFGQAPITFNTGNLSGLTAQGNQDYHISLIGDTGDGTNTLKKKTFWIEKECGVVATTGTIIIDKVSTGTNANQSEAFAFSDTIPTANVGSVAGNTPTASTTYTVTAADGPFSVTEDPLTAAQTTAGWTQGSASCSDATSNSTPGSINVAVGETVTCTFNNSFSGPTPTPDLRVTKTGTPESISVGGSVTFTLTVTNTGNAAANNVVLTDTMPAGLSFVSSTPGAPTCTGTATMTCQLGTLAAGASTIVTVVATGVTAGTHVNTAVVTPTDATPANNTDTEDTVVGAVADISVTKTVDDATVAEGDEVTFTLTVTNNGPSDATGVVVTDTLPDGLTFVSSDGSCTGTTTITCTIGDLAAGATATIHIVAETTESGTFTNGVEVVSETPDPDLSNNSDEVDVEVVAVRPDEVLPKTIHKKPKVLGKKDNALPFTGGALVFPLGGLGTGLVLMGGMLLLLDLRKRKAAGPR